MLSQKKIITFLVIMLNILNSCTVIDNQELNREEAFFSSVTFIQDSNQEIELVVIEEYPSVSTNSYSIVGLKINSALPIWFPYNYGLRIFYYAQDNNEWIEVNDKMMHSSNDPIIRKHDEKFITEDAILFWPDLSPNIKASEIRIVIEGKVMEEGKPSKSVNAFIDMPITH